MDRTCDEAAAAELHGDLVPLNAQRARATDKIEESTGALAALSPVLDLLNQRENELQEHIRKVKGECDHTKELTEYLEAAHSDL